MIYLQLIIFLILATIYHKMIKNEVLKFSIFGHTIGVLLMMFLPAITYFTFSSYDLYHLNELLSYIIVLYIATVSFSTFVLYKNNIDGLLLKRGEFKQYDYLLWLILIISIIFFLLIYRNIDNVLLMRSFDKSKNLFVGFDVLKNILVGSSCFLLSILINGKITLKQRIITIFLFLFVFFLLLGFGSRNVFIYPLIVILISFSKSGNKFSALKIVIPFITLLLVTTIVTSNLRDTGINSEDQVSKSFQNSLYSSLISFDQITTSTKIIEQKGYDLNAFTQNPLKLSFDFFLSPIPKEIFNFLGMDKLTYNSYLDWNRSNAEVGNLTPSYYSQILLQNGVIGLFFFPVNFGIILYLHFVVLKYFVERTRDEYIYITLLSLIVSGIFNMTRMVNFIYMAPFWFTLILFFFVNKKIKKNV